MVSIRFKDYDAAEGEGKRDSPGISVIDKRVTWEQMFDNEDTALYMFHTKIGIRFSLRWTRGEGYTSSWGIGDHEVILRKDFTRQHIDIAKSDTVDAAYEFFTDGAYEVDPDKYNESNGFY